jgi:photosystem II stability/assembly factor-like uncharacterized protein
MAVILAIGTRKGLFLARGTQDASGEITSWQVGDPHFVAQEVPAVAFTPWDAAAARLLVGVRSEHWGPTVVRSDDLGETWQETEHGSVRFPEDTGAALARVWQLHPDPVRPGLVWAGCEPTSLWRSTDGGETFHLVRGLWDHPHRPRWMPGFGGAAVHTVVTDPEDGDRLLVAMSAGGVYRTGDGGTSWRPSNSGISAYFLPDPNPEFGQCVHKVAVDASGTSRLYAQNHHGVYRSDDGGGTWQSIADGLPSDFGFVALAHPRRPGTAWLVPLEADVRRVPPRGRLRLQRTDDAGKTWAESGIGLPDGSWTSVLRDAACALDRGPANPPLVALGTRDGVVFAGADEGRTMSEVARHLPDVLSLRAVEVR